MSNSRFPHETRHDPNYAGSSNEQISLETMHADRSPIPSICPGDPDEDFQLIGGPPASNLDTNVEHIAALATRNPSPLVNTALLHAPLGQGRNRTPPSLAGSSSPADSAANSITCSIYGAEFTKDYGKGYFGRHMRTQHGGQDGGPLIFYCEAGCYDKTFKRTDARLKHYRKHHPGFANRCGEISVTQLDAERESRIRAYSSRLLNSNQPSQKVDNSLGSAAILHPHPYDPQVDSEGHVPNLQADTMASDSLQASNECFTKRNSDSDTVSLQPHFFTKYEKLENEGWKDIRAQLPESWMWDIDYHSFQNEDRGCWTYTPTDPDYPEDFPLTIAGDPVIIPVEYQWPPMAGVNPPPDPRPSAPIDPSAELPMDMVRDLFLTFEGSMGFYVLLNGLLQIIVSEEFDTEWASSHLPHKYGGLRVCYIPQSMSPTMRPIGTETIGSKNSQGSAASSIFGQFRPQNTSLLQAHHLNDFIEARIKTLHWREKFAGRIGLKTSKQGDEYVVMSTHVITEAILAKSQRSSIFGRKRSPFDQLDSDWNEHVEIWAGNEKIGSIGKTFDPDATRYPSGFMHDITLIKPANPSMLRDIQTPVSDLGWISREGWNSLRQQSNTVKILGDTKSHRAAKSLKTNRPSEVLVVGEGIFLNQNASIKPTKEHDIRMWKDVISRCLLYRVYPDFDPPNGYSGVAIYADGPREDGSVGPGVVGFQSFVQRSGHVQNFEMEGEALEKRLKLGRVAFYGAFQVPEELRKEHIIL